MQRSIVLAAAILLAAVSSFAQARPGFDLSNYGVRIEPDKRLIVVLSALQMAGTKDAAGQFTPSLQVALSPMGTSFREQLLRDNPEFPADLRTRITTFVAQHKRSHPGVSDADLVSPFISMAYALSPAPDLSDPVVMSDLPGPLLDVLDFAPLVREFYRRSTIASRLEDYVKEYRTASDSTLRTSAREMIGELLDYLHTKPQLIFSEKVRVEQQKPGSKQKIYTTETREHDRHFYLVPEGLAPRSTINFLNVRDDYFVVVPPDSEVASSEVRRAFLRFVMDPLVLANAKEMQPVRDWTKPVLDELRTKDPSISTDAFLALERSLVAAADIRETEYLRIRIATDQARRKIDSVKTDADKRAVSAELEKQKQAFADEAKLQLYEEYRKGAVLAFYFAEQFRGIEDSGFDIASSLKDMVQAFDGTRETARLASTAEARSRALAAREARKSGQQTVAVTPAENPVTTRLLQIQKTIDARDLPKAQADLKQLLSQYPAEPRIYYNLGRVAGLTASGLQDQDAQAAKLLEAKAAYTNVISSATANTDPTLLSLTYVALGRVYEFFNDDAYALKLYDKALQIGDVRGGAFSEAMTAKQRLIKTQP